MGNVKNKQKRGEEMSVFYRDIDVKISNYKSELSKPLVIFERDRGLEIYFNLVEYAYKIDKNPKNLLENLVGAYATVTLVNPDGYEISIDEVEITEDAKVKFIITEDLTDELTEIGIYQLQIHVNNDIKGKDTSVFSIPPFNFEVRERLKGKKSELLDSEGNGLTDKEGYQLVSATSNKVINFSADKINEYLSSIPTMQSEIKDLNSQLDNKVSKQELEVEKSRIDLLTKIQNGDTEGNTELLDIRIDQNGTEHPTAGEATRNIVIKNDSINPNKLNDEYINILQDVKLYINKSQAGYSGNTIYRIQKSGQTCTELIDIDLLGDEITVPLDDELEGQALIMYDKNKSGYYSKNVSTIKNNSDLQDYLIYNPNKKEYTFLVGKYTKNVRELGYMSFNFINSNKYIKRKADDKELKWLKVTENNLENEIILPKHINNSDILCDYIDFKENTYISTYTSNKITYTSTTNEQYASVDMEINKLSDEISFIVDSSTIGQVVVLKNNNNEYYFSLNAKLIINNNFSILDGYISYNSTTKIATISIRKLKEQGFNCKAIVISTNVLSNVKGYTKSEIKWLDVNDNKNNSKIEIRLMPEYVLLKGVEYNFYTNQTVMCSRKLDEKYMITWSYNGDGGIIFDDGIKIKENSLGNKSLRIKVFVEKNGKIELVDTLNTVIRIVENNVVNKNILFIGDSRIEDGSPQWGYRSEIPTMTKSILDKSNTLLGTRGGGSLGNHEGRSGWRSYDYCMNESFNGTTNAFFNSEYTDTLDGLTSHFDFSYYMNNNNYTNVDCVAIYLGANDNYNDNGIIYQKMIIKSIKAFDSNIKILLFSDYLSPCDNYSLAKSSLNYMTRRSQQMGYYKKQMQMIEDLGYSDITIVGANNVIDDWFDFNRETRKPSYRNSDNELIEYIVDVVHPKASGYDKIADLTCGHINYILS